MCVLFHVSVILTALIFEHLKIAVNFVRVFLCFRFHVRSLTHKPKHISTFALFRLFLTHCAYSNVNPTREFYNACMRFDTWWMLWIKMKINSTSYAKMRMAHGFMACCWYNCYIVIPFHFAAFSLHFVTLRIFFPRRYRVTDSWFAWYFIFHFSFFPLRSNFYSLFTRLSSCLRIDFV